MTPTRTINLQMNAGKVSLTSAAESLGPHLRYGQHECHGGERVEAEGERVSCGARERRIRVYKVMGMIPRRTESTLVAVVVRWGWLIRNTAQ